MSGVLLIAPDEDRVIDSVRPGTMGDQPFVSHIARPGEGLMTVGENRPAELPDPTLGGANGQAAQYGYSTGFQSYRATHQPFMGAVLQVPAEQLVVQGTVGSSVRADRLHAGVMDQLTQYTPSQADYVSSYVGPVYPGTVVTTNGR